MHFWGQGLERFGIACLEGFAVSESRHDACFSFFLSPRNTEARFALLIEPPTPSYFPCAVLPFIQEATIFLLPASFTIVLLAIATLFNINCASLLMSVW